MMIISRITLLTMLMGSSAVLSMEELGRKRLQHIDTVLEAVIKNDIELVQAYINDGGDINAKGDIENDPDLRRFIAPHLQEIIPFHLREMTLLMVAAFYGHAVIMKILLNYQAQLDCTNGDGDTASHMAARTMYTSLVRLLVKAGADKDIRNKNGKTPLDEANDSPLRSFYIEYSGKNKGKNHSLKEMIRLLESTTNNDPTSIETEINHTIAQINHTIAKIDDIKAIMPSKQLTKNSNKYTQDINTYHRLPSNNYTLNSYISNGTVYYFYYPTHNSTQMMHAGYNPAQFSNDGYYPQTVHNEYYPMHMNSTQHYPRQVMHNMHYADAYPTTAERTIQNYADVDLLGWSR
jgi:ankyrin repeat protein